MREQPTSRQGNEERSSQLKETIIDKAQKGVFNHNPMLSTTHFVTCQKCKHKQSVVYLDCLKSGKFELGKSKQIEVLSLQGAISFLEMEKVTPIIVSLICKECNCRIEARPVSAEYLKVIINKPKTSTTMYA